MKTPDFTLEEVKEYLHSEAHYIEAVGNFKNAILDHIERLETENAQLLEKVDRFSKVAFEQNMVILGKQDVITKQERVRANLQDEIWQLEQQIPRWISVEERLPEDYEDVVIIMRNGASSWYRVAYREYGGWSFGGGRRVTDEVTHWMPIPPMPKEDQP